MSSVTSKERPPASTAGRVAAGLFLVVAAFQVALAAGAPWGAAAMGGANPGVLPDELRVDPLSRARRYRRHTVGRDNAPSTHAVRHDHLDADRGRHEYRYSLVRRADALGAGDHRARYRPVARGSPRFTLAQIPIAVRPDTHRCLNSVDPAITR